MENDVATLLRRIDFVFDRTSYDEAGDLPSVLVRLAGVELADEDRMYLSGPILSNDWGARPDWLIDLVALERFEIVVEKHPGIVGPAEIVSSLWSAMHTVPHGGGRPRRTEELPAEDFPAELTEVYLWASVKTTARHYRRDPAELWQALAKTPIADADVLEAGGRLAEVHQLFALAIRRKVVGYVQREEAEARRQEAYRKEWAKKRPEPTPRRPRPGQQVSML